MYILEISLYGYIYDIWIWMYIGDLMRYLGWIYILEISIDIHLLFLCFFVSLLVSPRLFRPLDGLIPKVKTPLRCRAKGQAVNRPVVGQISDRKATIAS